MSVLLIILIDIIFVVIGILILLHVLGRYLKHEYQTNPEVRQAVHSEINSNTLLSELGKAHVKQEVDDMYGFKGATPMPATPTPAKRSTFRLPFRRSKNSFSIGSPM